MIDDNYKRGIKEISMLLMHLFKHVNYIYQFSAMQQPFITGLKLKNSLSNQLVNPTPLRNFFSLAMVKISDGTPVGQPCTPRVTWDTLGI